MAKIHNFKSNNSCIFAINILKFHSIPKVYDENVVFALVSNCYSCI